jgi:hypothetical protein
VLHQTRRGVLAHAGFGRREGRFGRRRDFGYGGYLGLPVGYAYDPWAEPGTVLAEPERPLRPEWPTSIGIPPSPVSPPAIYVIGRDRRDGARVSRRQTGRAGSGMQVSDGTSPRLASGPVFIPVPSGR